MTSRDVICVTVFNATADIFKCSAFSLGPKFEYDVEFLGNVAIILNDKR
jgi:hypothetical protein